ncbi:hypothetical protein CF95_gp096 [Erwinia phage PhiEaH1]|uniref:Uncharacterized protein n=1 Tax=Erwinia phage PhiEaH1 TaxID=1401669 RepID=W8D0H4_9CAUD|nr:hypothetical protein CF95_gp096 [Erwinia phage PhiEaH1]AGX01818.1 hypothetical protein [Erwinia phage PhiEaH1]
MILKPQSSDDQLDDFLMPLSVLLPEPLALVTERVGGVISPDLVIAARVLKPLLGNPILSIDNTNWITTAVTWCQCYRGQYKLQEGCSILGYKLHERYQIAFHAKTLCALFGYLGPVLEAHYPDDKRQLFTDVTIGGIALS